MERRYDFSKAVKNPYADRAGLRLDLTNDERQRLDALARRLNVTPEALAGAAVRDLLQRRDAAFETAADAALEGRRSSDDGPA